MGMYAGAGSHWLRPTRHRVRESFVAEGNGGLFLGLLWGWSDSVEQFSHNFIEAVRRVRGQPICQCRGEPHNKIAGYSVPDWENDLRVVNFLRNESVQFTLRPLF